MQRRSPFIIKLTLQWEIGIFHVKRKKKEDIYSEQKEEKIVTAIMLIFEWDYGLFCFIVELK